MQQFSYIDFYWSIWICSTCVGRQTHLSSGALFDCVYSFGTMYRYCCRTVGSNIGVTCYCTSRIDVLVLVLYSFSLETPWGRRNVEQFSGAFKKLRKATISFVMSVCLYICLSVRPSVRPSVWNNSAPTGRISMKIDIWIFFETL